MVRMQEQLLLDVLGTTVSNVSRAERTDFRRRGVCARKQLEIYHRGMVTVIASTKAGTPLLWR